MLSQIIATATQPKDGEPVIKVFYVKATLHHFGGKTSEIIMGVPSYSFWGDFIELGYAYVDEYVKSLTVHFIRISHYFIELGVINPDGTYKSIYSPNRVDIPLNMVFQKGKRGKFVTPEQHSNHPLNRNGGDQ